MPAGGLVTDKKIQDEVVRRAEARGITGDPDKAAHALGSITLPDGRTVGVHVIHAGDAIVTDPQREWMVAIDRKNNPGIGMPALPGGLLDPKKGGGVETVIQGAVREALEEAGIGLEEAKITLIGKRNMSRPFDVRIAKGNGLSDKYGVKDGDIFLVSTQAVLFVVPDLAHTKLTKGDDASAAYLMKVSRVTQGTMGIPDHFEMLKAALPECFPQPPAAKKNPKFGR